jgi:hypothetical protein
VTAPWVRPIALDDTDPPLRPLPGQAALVLEAVEAPPRLVAHLRAVHDVAAQLLDWIATRGLNVALDPGAVLFGAATHDIGKAQYTAELSGPGSHHEPAGRDLLLKHGVDPNLARFAATHATWNTDTGLEELLVSLADAIWKNKRRPDLEDLVVSHLATASGREVWDEFLALDDILTRIGDGADARLAYQMSYPVSQL